MAKQTRDQGLTYFLRNHTKFCDDQCPYFIGHSIFTKKPNWQTDMMFERWHGIGEQCRKRRGARPYRLYWRTNSLGIKYRMSQLNK